MKIIKFEQNNCPGCAKVGMFLNMVLETQPDKTYNLSTSMDAIDEATKYGIMTLPVLILLDEDEKEVQRVIGYDGKQEEIIEMVEKRKAI